MNAKYLIVAMMGLSLSAAGCSQGATDEELAALDALDYQYRPQENPTGGGTTNHLSPAVYKSHKLELLAAMDYALGARDCTSLYSCSWTHTLHSSIYSTQILDTNDGQDLFNTAVECALPSNQYVYQSKAAGETYPTTFTGQGLMTTTAGWFTRALTTAEKEDVLRCVIARVNAFCATVPIALSGQNVVNRTELSYDWQPDALWDVKIATYSLNGLSWNRIYEYVWPVAPFGGTGVAGNEPAGSQCLLRGDCETVSSQMAWRVCDDLPSNCGFQISENAANDCYRYPTGLGTYYYKCNPNDPTAGRPVVESWVPATLRGTLYPSCVATTPSTSMDISQVLFDPSYPTP